VQRSLITLKALIHEPTRGIVAAPTTSLPEQAGGVRNWDHRDCWLRDATFTLNTPLLAGCEAEAVAWRAWLLRGLAGSAEDLQILYSVTGERHLPECELPWLAGYEGAWPVRVGNAACDQFKLPVYGEVMGMLHQARAAGLEPESHVWQIQRALLPLIAGCWNRPDEGLWEIRGPRRHFSHSKVMAWVAFDRAVKHAESFGLEGSVPSWREVRDAIHAQVCERGADASLLLIPAVGFLPPEDRRVRATVGALAVVGTLLPSRRGSVARRRPSGALRDCCCRTRAGASCSDRSSATSPAGCCAAASRTASPARHWRRSW